MLEQDTSGSGVWEADSVLFEQNKKYLIEAPSGRGKTSLLSVVYGLRKDYRGKVYLEDQDISQQSLRDWSEIRKRKLSFIFQGLELFYGLTALDNIQLKNSITRFKRLSEIKSMADRLGIGQFLGKKAGILSFGQQQRVAILRAMCQPYEYLLADECFSHIDQDNSQQAFQMILEECEKQGAGMILTSLNETRGMKVDQHFRL